MRCPDCPTVLVARDMFADSFWPYAGAIIVPLVAITVVVMAVVRRRLGPVAAAGIALGIGLGGFADGILLHQVLQWHNMFASVIPPTEIVPMKFNMIWDGMFHAFTWLTCLAGVLLLFRAGRDSESRWSGRILGGAMLAGWGVFNFSEGILDHFILGIHHVRPGEHQLAWDIGFVAIGGVLFMLIGFVLMARHDQTRVTELVAAHAGIGRDGERAR